MRRIGEHAVVIGGSMAGLLAARSLTEAYERVTVVERDALPAGLAGPPGGAAGPPRPRPAAARAGVPGRAAARASAPSWPPPGRRPARRSRRCAS